MPFVILVYANQVDVHFVSLRCGCSRRDTEDTYGTRCEIKNVMGLRFLSKAIEFESARQIAILEMGEEVLPETRNFDVGRGVTVSIRSKEDEV